MAVKVNNNIKKVKAKVSVINDNIINMVFYVYHDDPDLDLLTAQFIDEKTKAILDKNPNKKFNILFDLSQAKGKGISLGSKSRRKYAEILKYKNINKTAIINGTPFLKVVAQFVIAFSKKQATSKIFDIKQEGLDWLKK